MNQQIQEIEGEPLRFHVPSDVRGTPPYLVDLESYGGNGECSCVDFDTHRRPALRRGEGPDERTRCKHIKRCRVYFTDKIIDKYIEDRRAARRAQEHDEVVGRRTAYNVRHHA